MGKYQCGRLKWNPCDPLQPNAINVTTPRHLAVEENSTVQQLLEEALDLLFQTRGKPLIAQIPKS